MKYLLVLLIAISTTAEERIFRCNLDDKARVLVFEKDQIACAYDTNTGEVWKIWQAKSPSKLIHFSGAVYDGRHGPQPKSLGKILWQNTPGLHWEMNGNLAQYYSYSPIDKTITMRIYRQNGSYITIVEKPLIGKEVLKRQVTIKGLGSAESVSWGNKSISTNSTKVFKVKAEE